MGDQKKKKNSMRVLLEFKKGRISPVSTCTGKHTATVHSLLFVACTINHKPLKHLSSVRCPRFQIIRRTKRERELSGDRKLVVQPKAHASTVCIHLQEV